MSSQHLHALRLLRPYRGYRSGEVIQATEKLAETLVVQGVAERFNESPGLFDQKPLERAVAARAAEAR